jgi:hypothetical protein
MAELKPLTPEWLSDIMAVFFGNQVTIDQLINHLDKRESWPKEFLTQVEYHGKREKLRSLIQHIKDEQGHRIVYSLARRDEMGRVEHLYVNEELFDVNDYREVVVDYYVSISQDHAAARHLRTNCYRRYGIEIETYEAWVQQQKRDNDGFIEEELSS